MNLSIEFGIPVHGWLPIKLSQGEFSHKLESSDVPVNPIDELCKTLILLGKGVENPPDILWWEEPYSFYYRFQQGPNQVHLKILSADTYNSPKRIEEELSGSFSEIVIPFYKELMEFEAKGYSDPHWPENDKGLLAQLDEIMKLKQTSI